MFEVRRFKGTQPNGDEIWVQIGQSWETREEAEDAKQILEALTWDDEFKVWSPEAIALFLD